jgi:hypothetical protein
MLETYANHVCTHRRISRLDPGGKVEEVFAGTHPFTQPHCGGPLWSLKVVGRREHGTVIRNTQEPKRR